MIASDRAPVDLFSRGLALDGSQALISSFRHTADDGTPLAGVTYAYSLVVDVATSTAFLQEPRIGPNPTAGFVQVDLSQPHATLTTRLFDLQGKLIQQQTYRHARQCTFEIKAPAGIYVLQLVSEAGEMGSWQIVKQ